MHTKGTNWKGENKKECGNGEGKDYLIFYVICLKFETLKGSNNFERSKNLIET